MSESELEEHLRAAVHIEPLALEEEFVRLPSDLAFFARQHADAYQQALVAKLDREIAEAELYRQAIIALSESGDTGRGGKPTEASIKSWINTRTDWQVAKTAEIEADADERRLRGVVLAIQAKKDALVSIGAHQRADMTGPAVSRTRWSEDDQGEENE